MFSNARAIATRSLTCAAIAFGLGVAIVSTLDTPADADAVAEGRAGVVPNVAALTLAPEGPSVGYSDHVVVGAQVGRDPSS